MLFFFWPKIVQDKKGTGIHTGVIKFPSTFCTRDRSGSVVECLNRDAGVEGSSLTAGTVLCPWVRHFNPCLLLVRISEKYNDWDVKNQIKPTKRK